MKNILPILGSLVLVETAYSAPIPQNCSSSAEFATKSYAKKGSYDKDGFETITCNWMPNGRAIGCTVSASKGGGEAMDTYLTVFNSTCTQLFRIELIGEE